MKKSYSLLLIQIIFVSSCAVHLASKGEPVPEQVTFEKEMTRFDVESNLGAPIEFEELTGGHKRAVYEFTTGTEPSQFRATAWLVSDILLAFLPELIGTPYEMLKGKNQKIEVIYNKDYIIDKVIEIN